MKIANHKSSILRSVSVADDWQTANLQSGFTLVELLVAIGLFSVIVTIAVGSFAKTLQTQRQVQALLSVNSNVSLALEQMAREMRTGKWFCRDASSNKPDTNSDCSPPSDHAGNFSAVDTLAFYDSKEEEVVYCLVGGAIRKNISVVAGLPVCDASTPAITGDNVNVDYLKFQLHGNQADDGYPPKITITVGVSPKESSLSGNVVHLETTVSSRQPDN